MPIKMSKIPTTGGTVFIHKCEICEEDAQFGIDVWLRKAFKALEQQNMIKAKEFLGKWYCYKHWKELKND